LYRQIFFFSREKLRARVTHERVG